MSEHYYENILNIKTSGKQDIEEATIHYNRYEPTAYSSLNELFEEYILCDSDSIVDFGCGKGRLNFYLHNKFKCTVTGIEMNNYLYKAACSNKKSYLEKYKDDNKINFVCALAQEYEMKKLDNKFYFFNPFSVEIFMRVVDNILGSVYEFEKSVEIILFYPSDDYIFFLENYTMFELQKEIRLENFKNDNRERFLIYKIESI